MLDSLSPSSSVGALSLLTRAPTATAASSASALPASLLDRLSGDARRQYDDGQRIADTMAKATADSKKNANKLGLAALKARLQALKLAAQLAGTNPKKARAVATAAAELARKINAIAKEPSGDAGASLAATAGTADTVVTPVGTDAATTASTATTATVATSTDSASSAASTASTTETSTTDEIRGMLSQLRRIIADLRKRGWTDRDVLTDIDKADQAVQAASGNAGGEDDVSELAGTSGPVDLQV
jgi:hypothetical protein